MTLDDVATVIGMAGLAIIAAATLGLPREPARSCAWIAAGAAVTKAGHLVYVHAYQQRQAAQ